MLVIFSYPHDKERFRRKNTSLQLHLVMLHFKSACSAVLLCAQQIMWVEGVVILCNNSSLTA